MGAMHCDHVVEIFACLRSCDFVKIDVLSTMTADLVPYLGFKYALYNVGRMPTFQVTGARVRALFIQECGDDRPGCRHLEAVK